MSDSRMDTDATPVDGIPPEEAVGALTKIEGRWRGDAGRLVAIAVAM